MGSTTTTTTTFATLPTPQHFNDADFESPAKILQKKKRATSIMTLSIPGTPPVMDDDATSDDETLSNVRTPTTIVSDEREEQEVIDSTADLSTTSGRLASQFKFKKPVYNNKYKQTHFHRPAKRNGLLHGLKRFFKKDNTSSASSNGSIKSSISSSGRSLSFANAFNKDIEARYGKWGRFVGKGAGGSVRVIRRSTDGKTFAVKQFRKRQPHEKEKDYVKKVTAEFCVGSTLHHPNIIETIDMVQEGSAFYEIMEYAPNDLFNVVMSGQMSREEIACCWRQMLHGVQYLHSMGIAHRDLKLDNMMLDDHGIVKLIDFGCSVVYKYPFDKKTRNCKGVCGSDPYIAPEQYEGEYMPAAADVWSCAIIFICMTSRRFPWKIPLKEDKTFNHFINHGPQRLMKLLPRESHNIITRMLETDPAKRCTIEQVLADPWVSSIAMCQHNEHAKGHMHHLFNASLSADNVIILDDQKQDKDESTTSSGSADKANKKHS